MPWYRENSKEMKHELPPMSVPEIEALIDTYIVGRNAERNRKILKRRFIDGIGYEPLSEEFKMCPRHTKTIVYKCEKILLAHMKK